MSDFAANGLGSSADQGGNSCLSALGYNCAFGGINPNAPPIDILSPVGRSTYDGLQMKWTDNVKAPFRGATGLNFTASYSLSRFKNTGGGVRAGRQCNRGHPATRISSFRRSEQRQRQQLLRAFHVGPYPPDILRRLPGCALRVPDRPDRALLQSASRPHLRFPTRATGAGEIFRTDFTGDGTTQDPLPGTHVGNFDRGINASNINTVISQLQQPQWRDSLRRQARCSSRMA